MSVKSPNYMQKFAWSLPWLMRYPLWRVSSLIRQWREQVNANHLILIVANHFEPAWDEQGRSLDWSAQQWKVEQWCRKARAIGDSVIDSDGTKFRHTYFFPAEQYHPSLIDTLCELQADDLGEVEIHLHHGIDRPDDAQNLRGQLERFRDILAYEHRCLSRVDEDPNPKYAFLHGNWALANSAGGQYCGVDSEMEILAETGCYADFTLPCVPLQSQVPMINAIYECGLPLSQRAPHRTGRNLRVSVPPKLPVLYTGPLVFNWRRRVFGLPVPRVDDGSLAANYPPAIERLQRWRSARIGVHGRPEWAFIKLYGHCFFPADEEMMIGEPMRRFLLEMVEFADRTGEFKVHFATAREAHNMAMAAVDGLRGEPGHHRDYQLTQIMKLEERETVAIANL